MAHADTREVGVLQVLHRQERFEEVRTRGKRYLAGAPHDLNARLVVVQSLLALGHWREVESVTKDGLVYHTRHPDLLHALGAALMNQGRFAEARDVLRAVLDGSPSQDVAMNLAHAAVRSGDVETTVLALRAAVAAAPAGAAQLDAVRTAAAWTIALGRFTDAASFARTFVDAVPNDAEMWRTYTTALLSLRRFREAEGETRRALTLVPDDADLLLTRSEALLELGETAESRAVAERALPLLPEERAAPLRLRLELALPFVADTAEDIRAARARILPAIDRLRADFERGVRFDPLDAVRRLPYMLAYHGEDNLEIRVALARLLRDTSPSLSFTAPHVQRPRDPNAKIRVGFLSALWGDTSITKSTFGLIANLDRARFHVVTFSLGEANGILADFLRERTDEFVVLPQVLDAARQQLAAFELDALYFAEPGAHAAEYLLTFSRLARVQMTSLGYPETTGVDTVDFFVTTPEMDPPGFEAQYTEALVRLSGTATGRYYFEPLEPTPGDRAAFNLPEGPLYACPQVPYKLHPDIDDLFAAVLRRDPRGHLVLLEGDVPELMHKLLARLRGKLGADAERVVMLPRLPEPDFNRFLQLVDVLLDPPYYSGYHTTLQALVLGTPVVTREGRFNRERHSTSMLRGIGLDVCVVSDLDAYVERCVDLANDMPLRAEVRATLQENGRRLLGEQAAVLGLEQFLESALA